MRPSAAAVARAAATAVAGSASPALLGPSLIGACRQGHAGHALSGHRRHSHCDDNDGCDASADGEGRLEDAAVAFAAIAAGVLADVAGRARDAAAPAPPPTAAALARLSDATQRLFVAAYDADDNGASNDSNACAFAALVAAGADPNARDTGGKTPLHYAAAAGHADAARRLVCGCGAAADAASASGATALHYAALWGRAEAAAALVVACGAFTDARNNVGQTPLQVAVAEGHDAVADVLARLGACSDDPNGERLDDTPGGEPCC